MYNTILFNIIISQTYSKKYLTNYLIKTELILFKNTYGHY